MLRSVKYGLHSAIIAGLVAVPIAWHSADKSVHLVVDGRTRTVQTTASDVAGALAAAGYRVGSHDLVAPNAHAGVHDGSMIVLQRGRQLHLTVDGRRTTVWTTAPTVAIALAQLGYTSGDFVSVSRDRRLPLGASDLAIRTPQRVTVVHDGRTQHVRTTDGTVGQLLSDLDITVGPRDQLSASASSQLRPDERIKLGRVTSKKMTRTKTVPYPTTKRMDASLYKGTTIVLSDGRDGRARITYSVVYLDGKPIGRTVLARDVLREADPKVIRIGTKKLAYDGTPASAQAIARKLLGDYGWGEDQMSCLVQMWNRESGWNPHAANPSGAYGIPQALPGSKMSVAGADWEDNPETQIKWGLMYIKARYSTPCGAWAFWQQGDFY